MGKKCREITNEEMAMASLLAQFIRKLIAKEDGAVVMIALVSVLGEIAFGDENPNSKEKMRDYIVACIDEMKDKIR